MSNRAPWLWPALCLLACSPKPVGHAPAQPTAAEKKGSAAAAEAKTPVDSAPPSLTAAPPPADPYELLVAAPSIPCSARLCSEPCCNSCGEVVWKLASDPSVKVVEHGARLPYAVATECALHYDLRAKGERHDGRFEVHTLQKVPSERGRKPGTVAQLSLTFGGGNCTGMACVLPPYCNVCTGVSWVPEPTFDAVTWSGAVNLSSTVTDDDRHRATEVTGKWLGPAAFEIQSTRTRTLPPGDRSNVFAGFAPATKPDTRFRVHVGEVAVQGPLSRMAVRRIVDRHMNEIRFCHAQGVYVPAGFSGRLLVQLVVSNKGPFPTVTVQQSSVAKELQQCVVDMAGRWTFPEAKSGEQVTVSVPFVFKT